MDSARSPLDDAPAADVVDVPIVDVEVIVVGSGFSGLGMAIRLLQAGRDGFVVLEQSAGLGGTWRDNDYPGCACDVPSDLYSFSFARHPTWSRKFAPQKEILAYLQGCAERFGVLPHVRFGRRVTRCVFDDASGRWTVTTTAAGDGTVERWRCRHLVFGLGALHRPRWPAFAGRERFAGPSFHSSQWRHDVDLRGKRVAVVGTGASSIQFVPEIARVAREVVVFQRTPPWVLPKGDRAFGAVEQRVRRAVPGLQGLARAWTYLTHESRVLGFTVDPRLMTLLEKVARWHLQKQVKDPTLRARLTPDYMPGCKRLLISNDWYPALQRDNVRVVDDAIAGVDETGVVTGGAAAGQDDQTHHDVDVIVYGTGFIVTDPLGHLDVRGRGGVTLQQVWRDGIEAYRGTHVAGFPNLSILMGPNTGLGHNSMVYMIESQLQLVLDELEQLEARGQDVLEVKSTAQAAWNAALQPRLQRSVWASGCTSWYLDDQGRNGTAWPGFTFEFRRATRRAEPGHFLWSQSPPAPTGVSAPADAQVRS